MDGLKKIVKAIASLKWYEIVMCVIMIAISTYYAVQPQEGTPQWLAIINFVSGLCGVICVFLCAKANRMNFPFAVVNTTVYMVYLAYFGIWATFLLEAIVYFPMNIISWAKWYQHKDADDELLAKSKKLNWWQNAIVVVAISGIAVIVHYLLSAIAGDTWMNFAVKYGWNTDVMKWLDSVIFSIGVVAVTLEMLRYTEQYVWWLITDFVSIAQYVIKGDPVYIAKRSIYTVEAFIGLYNWAKLSKKNKANE